MTTTVIRTIITARRAAEAPITAGLVNASLHPEEVSEELVYMIKRKRRKVKMPPQSMTTQCS